MNHSPDPRPPGPLPSSRRLHILCLALLFVVAAAPFAAAWLKGQMPWYSDIRYHWFPLRLHAYRARIAGDLPHWCRFLFCGSPFLGQADAAVLYPPNLLLDLFHPAATLVLRLVAHRFVLGALVYAALAVRGVSPIAALTGALLFLLSGVSNGAIRQPALLRSLAWLPGLLLATWYLNAGRWRAGILWSALSVSLAVLGGYPGYLARAGLVVPFLLLLEPAGGEEGGRIRRGVARFGAFGLGSALAVGLCAVQLVPTLHLTSLSQRAGGIDLLTANAQSATLGTLGLVFFPRFDVPGLAFGNAFGYVGVSALAIGILPVLRRDRRAIPFGLAAATGLVLSLGDGTPLGRLLVTLPVFRFFRHPTHHLVLFALAACPLAAIGVDEWRRRRPRPVELANCVAPLLAIVVLRGVVPTLPVATPDRIQLLAIVGVLLGVATAGAGGVPRRLVVPALALLVLFDAGSISARGFRAEFTFVPVDRIVAASARGAQHEAEDPGAGYRVTTPPEPPFLENLVILDGRESVKGNLSLVPLRTVEIGLLAEQDIPPGSSPGGSLLCREGPDSELESPLLDRMALRWAVGYESSPGSDWRRAGEDVWERSSPPEAGFAAGILEVHTDDEERAAVVTPDFREGRTVVVRGRVPGLATGDGTSGAAGRVRRMDWPSANECEMKVSTPVRALLRWAESWDDGWRAEIDGEPAVVQRVDYAFMGVIVPRGDHRIRWTYASPGWRIGMWVSVLSILAFGLLLVSFRLRPR